ncbi:MAG: glycosyl transferase family 9 [Nitrospirales bacterium]|nr:MAG: glycosyl transferase family 9 [Nitrospirales bacterium]
MLDRSWKPQLNNILVIKLRYIGDVVLSTPVLSMLRRQFPHANLVCLVNPGTQEVLQHNPHVDDVVVMARGSLVEQIQFWLELRRRQFDCVIDLTDGDRSAFLTWISGASRRIGFNSENRWRGKLYSHCISSGIAKRHMVEYHMQALTFVDVPSVVQKPEVFAGPEQTARAHARLDELGLLGRRWVMVHPTARYWFKAWPVERFARLCDRLAGSTLSIVLVGDTRDQEIAAKIQEVAKTSIFSLVGKTPLLELAAMMKHAALFIGNDTGMMHIASAVGCPVVGLFGPTNPETWGPRGARTKVIYKGLDCRACFRPGCFRGEESCMKLISVDEVYEAARELLREVEHAES